MAIGKGWGCNRFNAGECGILEAIGGFGEAGEAVVSTVSFLKASEVGVEGPFRFPPPVGAVGALSLLNVPAFLN